MSAYACRICSSPEYDVVLDYGQVVLADAFLPSLEASTNEPRYPLTLVLCRNCLHVQILEVLAPALLRYAEGILGSRSDAEEAVQDAFKLGDVEVDAGPAQDLALFVADGDAAGQDGVDLAVGAQEAVLALPMPARSQPARLMG